MFQNWSKFLHLKFAGSALKCSETQVGDNTFSTLSWNIFDIFQQFFYINSTLSSHSLSIISILLILRKFHQSICMFSTLSWPNSSTFQHLFCNFFKALRQHFEHFSTLRLHILKIFLLQFKQQLFLFY